jgi:hypothetical protein
MKKKVIDFSSYAKRNEKVNNSENITEEVEKNILKPLYTKVFSTGQVFNNIINKLRVSKEINKKFFNLNN